MGLLILLKVIFSAVHKLEKFIKQAEEYKKNIEKISPKAKSLKVTSDLNLGFPNLNQP